MEKKWNGYLPSFTNWWARHINFRELILRKCSVTVAPKSQPAPRGLVAHVSMVSSGSDHTRSQKAPSWGISWPRSIIRIWSKVFTSGDKPPCTQRISSSINCHRKNKNWPINSVMYFIANTWIFLSRLQSLTDRILHSKPSKHYSCHISLNTHL